MCRNNKYKKIYVFIYAINKPIFHQSIKIELLFMGGRCGSSTEGQQHLWAQNDCYYSFLLLLLLSKPMSRPGTVRGAPEKPPKQRNVPGIRRVQARQLKEKKGEKLPPTCTMSCAKIYVLFVYLFMQCFVNCSPTHSTDTLQDTFLHTHSLISP